MISKIIDHICDLHRVLVANVCCPLIYRFLTSTVDRSTEILHLEIVPSGARFTFGGASAGNNTESNTPVTLYIDNPIHFCWLMILDRKIGLGEAYMAGDWRAEPNPIELLKLLIRAKKQTTPYNSSLTTLQRTSRRLIQIISGLVTYIQHRIKDNTVSQSARNIREHYDLGNDMFSLFLDSSMTYSCAIFKDPSISAKTINYDNLHKAQIKKIDSLLTMLDLNSEDHVLEIGCGWGSCAIRGVQQSGCRWTGLTISREQLEWARNKVDEANLNQRINLKYQDYRLTKGIFTKIISIEMIEAVGQAFLPQYFQIISDRLTSGGTAVLQAIICPDIYYDRYCRSSDFIKKYIFPGGHMPSIGAITTSLPTDLTMTRITHIGRHYATTLEYWYNSYTRIQVWIIKIDEGSLLCKEYFLKCMDVTREGYHLSWLLPKLPSSVAVLLLSLLSALCKRSH
uniref:Cyclopropane-fatty-acyl-phospholipid synthase n=1 Tax=Heterorhabditis bacteriophora TaxID=37862 RepID=A0A1I7XPV6_HETBA